MFASWSWLLNPTSLLATQLRLWPSGASHDEGLPVPHVIVWNTGLFDTPEDRVEFRVAHVKG